MRPLNYYILLILNICIMSSSVIEPRNPCLCSNFTIALAPSQMPQLARDTDKENRII